MNRRGFLKGLAKACGVVALAGQLAFKVKPVVEIVKPKPKVVPFWIQTTRASAMYDEGYLRALASYETKIIGHVMGCQKSGS